MASLDDVIGLLDKSLAGRAAKKKTRTVLNRLWLEPRADLTEFADRAVQIYRDASDTSIPALTWGMAIATYPFFGKVAEIVGRLTALQGDCTSGEVHRRMTEIYGQREGTRRMTNMVLQSQASWGAVTRSKKGQVISRNKAVELHESPIATWLAEACLRYAARALPVAAMLSSPVVFPFILGGATQYELSRCRTLEMGTDSAGNPLVALAV
jgi:hypothetical protein